jgi:hypothetical protein
MWARRHLDHLLLQGRNAEIREQIIALSEAFQIMTPYTSFLVLESEADRERFKVQKRFRMRGGEEFFAEGRDRAEFELTREQMRRARLWRKQIRDEVLRVVQGMARDQMDVLQILPGPLHPLGWDGRLGAAYGDQMRVSITGGMAGSYGQGLYDVKKEAKYSRSLQTRPEAMAATDAPLRIDVSDAEISTFVEADADALEQSFELDEMNLPLASDIRMPVAEPPPPPREAALEEVAAKRALKPSGLVVRGGRARTNAGVTVGLTNLFPGIQRGQPRATETEWSRELRDLVAPLDRRAAIAGLRGGVRIVTRSQRHDVRRRVIGDVAGEYLLSRDASLRSKRATPRRGPHPSIGISKTSRRAGTIRSRRSNGSTTARSFSHGATPRLTCARPVSSSRGPRRKSTASSSTSIPSVR